ASLFHLLNDAATITVPMIFPLFYSQQFIIRKYSHIGILSNLGFLVTFLFQIIIANVSDRLEYRSMLFFSFIGISISLVLITFSSGFASLLFIYLIMRVFNSFYHSIGVAWVSKTHPSQAIDFAMGIQSGSGNLGVFVAFVSSGFLAQNFGWKIPLFVWAGASFFLGLVSFLSVRRISTMSKERRKLDLASWMETLRIIRIYIPGFVFGGACWGATIYYAPSLFNHKFQVPLGQTGLFLAFWIGIGTVMTYIFGFIVHRFSRIRVSLVAFGGASFFLFLLGTSIKIELAVGSLFFFGAFLFLIYPAFQSFVGNSVPEKNQTQAFSLAANAQMLAGSIVVLISGFLSDKFGINSPFIFLGIIGILVLFYYMFKQTLANKTEALL
ncbi:MAG: MFS transporter, partial [Candidatus Aminicenantes bacterium]